jgi:hypothetical protein
MKSFLIPWQERSMRKVGFSGCISENIVIDPKVGVKN